MVFALDGFTGVADVYLGQWATGRAREAATAKSASELAVKKLGAFSKVFPIGQPASHRYAGGVKEQAGDVEAARKEWEQGIATAVQLQMPYEEGRLRLSLGRLAKDRAHLEAARDLFEATGAATFSGPRGPRSGKSDRYDFVTTRRNRLATGLADCDRLGGTLDERRFLPRRTAVVTTLIGQPEDESERWLGHIPQPAQAGSMAGVLDDGVDGTTGGFVGRLHRRHRGERSHVVRGQHEVRHGGECLWPKRQVST